MQFMYTHVIYFMGLDSRKNTKKKQNTGIRAENLLLSIAVIVVSISVATGSSEKSAKFTIGGFKRNVL